MCLWVHLYLHAKALPWVGSDAYSCFCLGVAQLLLKLLGAANIFPITAFSLPLPLHPPDISMRLRSFLIWSKCRSETSWHPRLQCDKWLGVWIISLWQKDRPGAGILGGKKAPLPCVLHIVTHCYTLLHIVTHCVRRKWFTRLSYIQTSLHASIRGTLILNYDRS